MTGAACLLIGLALYFENSKLLAMGVLLSFIAVAAEWIGGDV